MNSLIIKYIIVSAIAKKVNAQTNIFSIIFANKRDNLYICT